MTLLKKIKIFLTLVLLVLGCSELFLRFMGALDFPIYQSEEDGHYFLKSNQNGVFLNKNRWFVNSSGFNNKEEIDLARPYIMLVGDSVVYGGNPIDYEDRIGFKLEKEISQHVYIGGLGGWSLYNEMKFINKNLNVAKNANLLVIQYDNGDLSGLAKVSPGNGLHPLTKPVSANYYYFNKYIYPKIANKVTLSELPPIPEKAISRGNWEQELLKIANSINGKILFILYPDKQAFLDGKLWEEQTHDIKKFLETNSDKFSYIDMSKDPAWNPELYRDGIHPNIEGNQLVATAIAKYIKQI